MNLKAKSLALVATCFLVIFAGSYAMLQVLSNDIRTGLATRYAQEQVNYNREKVLHPVMRELALARKLAGSEIIRNWAKNEDNPDLKTAALTELEGFRKFFSDHSYFFAIKKSGHYYFNDRENHYRGAELRYTLNPNSQEDFWFYRTLESQQAYALNVDYDEKLKVTKVWINVVVRDAGQPLGVIGTGIDLSNFISSVVTSDQPGVTNIFVEGSGAIQADYNKSSIDFRTISKKPTERKTIFQLLDSQDDVARLHAAIARLKSGENGVETLSVGIGGKNFLVGVGAIRAIGWYSITLFDTTSLIGPRYIIPFAVLLFIALLLLSTALVMLLNRFVIKRIHHLEHQMRGFSRGEEISLAERVANDEMGHLETSFQQMGTIIRQHERTLEDKVAERTRELEEKNIQLNQALSEIKVLSGLLPICMYCKGIRNDQGAWTQLEQYIAEHSDAQFSHGICDKCMAEKFPEYSVTNQKQS